MEVGSWWLCKASPVSVDYGGEKTWTFWRRGILGVFTVAGKKGGRYSRQFYQTHEYFSMVRGDKGGHWCSVFPLWAGYPGEIHALFVCNPSQQKSKSGIALEKPQCSWPQGRPEAWESLYLLLRKISVFYFLLLGMDRNREGWEGFCLGSICVWYCHGWWELWKCEAGPVCDCWKRVFILANRSCKCRVPVRLCEKWAVAKTLPIYKSTLGCRKCVYTWQKQTCRVQSCVYKKSGCCLYFGFFLHPFFL